MRACFNEQGQEGGVVRELFLLGDSIIDNSAYIGEDEPDVPEQVRQELGSTWTVTSFAVDGDVSADVIAYVARVPAGAPVFLSSGGNDALGHKHRLASLIPRLFPSLLSELWDIREAFRADYAALLGALEGRPVMVATIYNPNYTGVERMIQKPAEGGLSAFNDVIQQEAIARGFAVLDLRRLFCEVDDYANPIEPSRKGGAKIASAVAKWATALPQSSSN